MVFVSAEHQAVDPCKGMEAATRTYYQVEVCHRRNDGDHWHLLPRGTTDTEQEAHDKIRALEPGTARIWRTESTRTAVPLVTPALPPEKSARPRVEPVLHVKWDVIAYDCSGYGEDRSREFTDGQAAVDYARSLEPRFGASVHKRITMDPISVRIPV